MQTKTQKLLEESGVDKIQFYHVKTPILNNAYTACVLCNTQTGTIEARGIAICSLMDAYNIAKGKQKAFGRAIKALHRKGNFYKINASGRKGEVIQRSFKVKTTEDDEKFRSEIIPELRAIEPSMMVKSNVNETFKKYMFDLPLSYPVQVANRRFKYKSQFRPAPVGEELTLFASPAADECCGCGCTP